MEFLKTNNTAEVPVFYEGLEHEEDMEEGDEGLTESADTKAEDESEVLIEGKDEDKDKDKKIEGFNTAMPYALY